ncbi:MAG: TIGR03960 family B12-binding radical SAM protein [Oscillospiraceae bacterium]|nr:TIGR03960 family B12-binding radical SAM protein [Oscillospiraceae bacterium]
MTPYQRVEPFLTAVKKPARYTGGEFNTTLKDPRSVDLRVAFCFPDTYEIGMSCLGLRILYDVINRLPAVWCERAFAPWEDMRALLLRKKIPLYALESGDALSDFDVLAFTVQTELSYTNILSMLDLAGLPLRAAERDETHPIVIAGGSCAFHPEPLADFIDLFAVGEGEEVIVELMELFREKLPRVETLARAAEIEGVYVPSYYTVSYNKDGTIKAVEGKPVQKRVVRDLNSVPYPEKHIAVSTEIVHDRVMLELFRGCARGCRFCQAGHISRPVREKSPETLAKQAIAAVESSGAGEIGLVSLSTSDYAGLEALCDTLVPWCGPRRVSLSLPSLRADSFSPQLLQRAGQVRKSGLTFAPEAGSERLRNVINKNLQENDLLSACSTAFTGGWNGVKLYFMLGLPTETDEDVREIAELCGRIYRLSKTDAAGRSRRITASASCFVPKPHTPFQWEPMVAPDELLRRAGLVRGTMRKQVTFHWHEPETAYWECVLSRGDRRLGAVLERAYRLGCRMDGWRECFSPERWREAFALEGLEPDFYALRRREPDEVLPWSHISCGVSVDHLKREREKAYRAEPSKDCRNHCERCGVCR